MRFEEFLDEHALAAIPADHFAGYLVEVGVPTGWGPLVSAIGLRVWVRQGVAGDDAFCENAVLTMHRVEASLNAGDVFDMLANQQVLSVPGGHEMQRDSTPATDGPGIVAVQTVQITGELGTIESASRTRIVSTAKETLIAQLTVTARSHSRADRGGPWLTLRSAGSKMSRSADNHGGAPVPAIRNVL